MPVENEGMDVINITAPLPLKQETKKERPKWKRVLFLILKILVAVLVICGCLYSAEIIWLYSSFTPFYVVGDSMWPTLNSDAKRSNGGEENHTGNWGNYVFGTTTWYTIDFGFMDTTDFIDDLERFDILVTHYPGDAENVGYKIKRIIGLPGETIYFDDQGELFVKAVEATEFEKIDQSSFSMRDQERTNEGSEYAYSLEKAYTIPEDSYFLVGDNRSSSTDSRSIGAVPSSYFRGKAIYIVGTCHYTEAVANATASPGVNWLSFRMPWNFQVL